MSFQPADFKLFNARLLPKPGMAHNVNLFVVFQVCCGLENALSALVDRDREVSVQLLAPDRWRSISLSLRLERPSDD